VFDGYNSIDVLYFFPLTLPRLLPYWTVYMVTRRVSYKRKNCLPFVSTLVHPRNVGGVHVAHLFSCFVLFYDMSLHSEFRVVMSVTMSA
jgi:hypothetical protein